MASHRSKLWFRWQQKNCPVRSRGGAQSNLWWNSMATCILTLSLRMWCFMRACSSGDGCFWGNCTWMCLWGCLWVVCTRACSSEEQKACKRENMVKSRARGSVWWSSTASCKRVVKQHGIMHSYIVLAYVVAFVPKPQYDYILCVKKNIVSAYFSPTASLYELRQGCVLFKRTCGFGGIHFTKHFIGFVFVQTSNVVHDNWKVMPITGKNCWKNCRKIRAFRKIAVERKGRDQAGEDDDAGRRTEFARQKSPDSWNFSSEFWVLGTFSSNVKINLVISWNGDNSFQRTFPSNSRNFTTHQPRGLFL